VEAAAAAAMEAVPAPNPVVVDDADVLFALIERGDLSQDALLAVLDSEKAVEEAEAPTEGYADDTPSNAPGSDTAQEAGAAASEEAA